MSEEDKARQSLAAVEYAVLGLLRMRPMHGYGLAKYLAPGQQLGLLCPVNSSAVYPLLRGLEGSGLISSRIEKPGSRPSRVVFAITSAGQALLEGWLSAPVEPPRKLRLNFLLKWHFVTRDEPAKAARLIAEQLAAGEHYLADLDIELAPLAPNSLERLTMESNRAVVASFMKWMRDKRDHLLTAVPAGS